MHHTAAFISPTRLRALQAPVRHYLWLGLALSLLTHAGLLAWHGNAGPAQRPATDILEVALVNAGTQSAPAEAVLQAQVQVDGGGDAQSGYAATPLPRTGASAQSLVLQALRRRQAELEARQLQLLTQLQSSRIVQAVPPGAREGETGALPGDADADQPAVVENAQIAALSERVRHYSRKPRKQFVAPSAVASTQAAYVDAWRTRIEAIGTRHYPAGAGEHVYGFLRMTVTVRANGSVAGIAIDQPSSSPLLNNAARRIVQLASPFAPFPPELARSTDMLVITRTWHFVNETLTTQNQ